jgi:GPH family glycoside/pentoside/hexuronide:cation symporter
MDTGLSQLMSAFLVFFLTTVVGLNPWLAGLIWSIQGVFGVITSLVIGSLSDRTRTRWGRRRPFIAIGIPTFLLFTILIWSPPLGGKPLTNPNSLPIFFYMLIVVIFYGLGGVMVNLNTDSLFPEIWEDQKDRSEVTIYREILAVVGAMIAMVLFPFMITLFGSTFSAWAWAGGITAAIFACCAFISLFGMRERKEFSLVDKHLPLIASFKAALTNKTWIAYVGANLMTSCLTDSISLFSLFFVEISLGLTAVSLSIMMGVYMVVYLPFFLFWRMICTRYGTKMTLAVSMVAFCIGALPAILFGKGILGACIMGLMMGLTLGGLTLARAIMWAEVIDDDEIKTGVRREGMYCGVASPIGAIDPIVLGLGSAFLLTSIGFVSGAKVQPSSVGPGIRIGMIAFPAIFTAVMLIFLYFYPLTKKRVDEMSKEIEKIHVEKAKKLEEMKV